jgi:hypothetical protein
MPSALALAHVIEIDISIGSFTLLKTSLLYSAASIVDSSKNGNTKA